MLKTVHVLRHTDNYSWKRLEWLYILAKSLSVFSLFFHSDFIYYLLFTTFSIFNIDIYYFYFSICVLVVCSYFLVFVFNLYHFSVLFFSDFPSDLVFIYTLFIPHFCIMLGYIANSPSLRWKNNIVLFRSAMKIVWHCSYLVCLCPVKKYHISLKKKNTDICSKM